MSRHPNQHIKKDAQGHFRFIENKIVRFLLDQGPFDMNKLGVMGFSQEDQSQFAQLIGYSVEGFAELSYHDPTSLDEADRVVAWLKKREEKRAR